MRLSKHKRETTSGMNITPMIDIVFLLLIFFITVSQISESNKERIALSKRKGEEQTQANLVVNVNEKDEIVVSTKKVTTTGLLVMVGDEIEKAGGDPQRLTIVIRADRTRESKAVNEIIHALAKLAVGKVKFAVEVP